MVINLELIIVGNGDSNYPGNFTKKERFIINENKIGFTLNLFSGISKIGHVRVDFNCKEATNKMDVFYFLDSFNIRHFETVIIDASYNQRFADKYQKIGNTPKQFVIFASVKKTTELFNHVKRLSPDIVILKSWNYYCLKGYEIKKCYICYLGGYRKSTFLIIMKKKRDNNYTTR